MLTWIAIALVGPILVKALQFELSDRLARRRRDHA